MFNKKGQQEVSMGTVLLIIIGVIAVVLIVVSVTGGFDYIESLIGKSPGDLTAFSQSCVTYSKARLYNDYCREFREGEILGVDGFFNCQYDKFEDDIKKDAVTLDCLSRYGVEYESDESSAEKYCSDSKSAEGKEFDEDMKVNGKSCERWLEVSASAGGAQEEAEERLAEEGIIEELLVEFRGEQKEVLTEEQCESGLEERRRGLELPNELCYWAEMAKLYDEKCENLDIQQVETIFKKKENYRGNITKEWPTLNVKQDFCSPIVYDCSVWKKSYAGRINVETFGFFRPSDINHTIFINPFLVMSKEEIKNTVLHEALHAIQDGSWINILGGSRLSQFTIDLTQVFDDIDPALIPIVKKRDELTEKIVNIYNKWGLEELRKCFELEGEKRMECRKVLSDANVEAYGKYLIKLQRSTFPLKFSDFVKEDNLFYNRFKSDEEYKKAVEELNAYLLGDEYRNAIDLFVAYFYTAEMNELDPRLSEVNRWWLDQTAPNCLVVETSEKAREVLDLFLKDENIPELYKITQRQLNDVLEVARRRGGGEEQKVYDALVARLPGLAEAETDGETFA